MAHRFTVFVVAFAVLVSAGVAAHAQSINLGGKSYPSSVAYLTGEWQTPNNGKPIRMNFTAGGVLLIDQPSEGIVRHGVYEIISEGLVTMIKRVCVRDKCNDMPPANPMLWPFKPVEPNKFLIDKEEWERISNR
jgi:hypothetical protein